MRTGGSDVHDGRDFAADEQRMGGLAEKDRGSSVDAKYFVELGFGQLPDGMRPKNGGVIHKDVEL
jgi:hypothetical protein